MLGLIGARIPLSEIVPLRTCLTALEYATLVSLLAKNMLGIETLAMLRAVKKALLLLGAIRTTRDPKIDATLEDLPIPQVMPTSFDIAR